MTEAEWFTATDYHAMLIYLRGDGALPPERTGLHCGAGYLADGEAERVSKRKLRLFAAALCQKWWKQPLDESSQAFLRTYEKFTNDEASWEQVFEAGMVLQEICHRGEPTWISPMALMWTDTPHGVAQLGDALAWTVAGHVAKDSIPVTCKDATEEDKWLWGFSGVPDPLWLSTCTEVYEEYPAILREIIGNPFRPSPYIGAGCLAWNDGTIPKIAWGIYNDRGFDRLPVLADALEEAGCSDVAVLEHCRRAGGHLRGCWVVDLLLGKE